MTRPAWTGPPGPPYMIERNQYVVTAAYGAVEGETCLIFGVYSDPPAPGHAIIARLPLEEVPVSSTVIYSASPVPTDPGVQKC